MKKLTINDIPENLFNNIPHFLTGSVRFGRQRSNSDLDIAIPIMFNSDFMKKISTFTEIKKSNYNNGYKFTIKNVKINIIPLHPLDFVCWFHAAYVMEQMPNMENKDRTFRHATHEMLVGLMKNQFTDVMINKDNYRKYIK